VIVPKPVPFTVTCVKGGPETGLIEVLVGAAHAAAVSSDQQSNNLKFKRREFVQPPIPLIRGISRVLSILSVLESTGAPKSYSFSAIPSGINRPNVSGISATS
jgi:hypothetical protein